MSKPIETISLWAAISKADGPRQRTRWIHNWTIRRTRKEARAAYLEGWSPEPEHQRRALSWVTFERVIVTGAQP